MKALHVIRREYVASVRKRSFIISTVLVPLFMIAMFAVPLALTFFVPNEQVRVVVLDETGAVGGEFAKTLTDTLRDGLPKYVASSVSLSGEKLAKYREDVIGQVRAGSVDVLLVIPGNVLADGKVSYITREVRNFVILETFEDSLSRILLKERLAREGLDYDRVSSLTHRVTLQMSRVTSAGGVEQKDILGEWGVVALFTFMLYMTLISWGMTISRGIIEEKSSRVVEVLLAALRPVDLMVGKVVGIGLAGLTQLCVWVLVGLSVSVYGATVAGDLLDKIAVPPMAFVFCLVYFVLGFLLYSAMFTVVGAVCNTDQDAQQLQGLITLPLGIPLLALMLVVQSPNGAFAVAMSLFPLCSPLAMLARIILVDPPLWQILLSIVLLLVSIYGAIAFSARVFRVGILMYGKRPNLREIVRWYRLAR